jgi:hypothetical protein
MGCVREIGKVVLICYAHLSPLLDNLDNLVKIRTKKARLALSVVTLPLWQARNEENLVSELP